MPRAMLDELGVALRHARSFPRIARRTGMIAFAKGAKAAGFKVIIAGAGGAAHLPGMTASHDRSCRSSACRLNRRRCAARTACSPSCRCRPAFPSAPWRSARPARPMPACWRPRPGAFGRSAGAAARGLARGADRGRRRSARATKAEPWPAFNPARPSASWAADSLAACWPWRRRGSASSTIYLSTRTNPRLPRRPPTRHIAADYARHGSAGAIRASVRRHHL